MAKKNKFIWLKIIGALILIFFSASLFVLAKVAKIAKELPDPEQFVASHQVNQSSKIYDRTGEILLYEIYSEEKRTVIPFEKMPDYVKKATIAIEDKNFYEHPALDWRALIRAFLTNIIEGRVVQGGSTITQQLAKNAFLSSEKTYERKIKELILAYWIEKKYSKDEILELYLNQIPYGNNAYGVEAAAKTYFGKSAEELSLAESALLASVPKAPTYYSPYGSHKDELIQRKDYILEQMLGIGFIDDEEFGRAKDYQYKFEFQNIGSIKAPHFVMMVKDYLAEKYGESFLKNGGLKITTTLDWNLQQTAELVIKEGAERNEKLYKGKNAALVAQDPKTGQILTLVGSKDYFDVKNDGNFNVATQGLRQPGSAFKPFAYLSAFKKGYTPQTIVFDLPTEFTANNPNCPLIVDFSNKLKECYHPENFDRQFRGPVNLKNALAQSINIPAIKVLYLAGIGDTIKTAKDMGITTLNDVSRYGLSLVLGGGEVKLIDLVNAYAVFSQEGIKHNQKIILKIEDFSGKTIESATDQANKVVDPQYIRLITDILSDNEARSPLYQNSFNLTTFEGRQVALKTGTSNDYIDAWTVGYTPNLVVGVWAGNNDNAPMQKQAGSILAALPIWNSFMVKILNNFPVEFFNDAEKENQYINKTMLNGNYVDNNNSVHNILYYIDKNNPMGEIPLNPKDDSQFLNWEIPVQNWFNSQPTG